MVVMITFDDATVRIQRYLDSKGRAANTARGYIADVGVFFKECGLVELPLDQLEDTGAAWLNKHRRTIPTKTTCRRLTSLRTLAKVYGVIALAEYTAPTPAKGTPHPLPQGEVDLRRMLEECIDNEQRVLLALTGMCGLRITEARELHPQNICLKTKTLKVLGKGARERVVPISDAAWEILLPEVVQALLTGANSLITLPDRSARYCITMLGQRAGIGRRVASHDLRATFGTEAYGESGNDIRVVQELLGHADVNQTTLYVGVRREALRNAVNFVGGNDEQD